jgi:hypothetical protein
MGALFDFLQEHGLLLQNLGQAYTDIYAGYERNIGREYSVLEIMVILGGVFKLITFTLGVFYFTKLSRALQAALITTIAIYVFGTLFLQGKQKQMGDIVIFMSGILLIKYQAMPVVWRRRVAALLLVLFVGGVSLFTYIQMSRYTAINIDIDNFNLKTYLQAPVNHDHWVFKLFGPEIGFGLTALLGGYLGGGYYGLSLCLQLPFVWTLGAGHSYSLSVFFERFLGTRSFLNDTYLKRMEFETGYPALQRWHTIFPWLASDLTFYGALAYMALVAYVYAISWREATERSNPLSIVMFSMITLMLFFVPANNQLFHSPESFLATWVIILAWLWMHRRFNNVLA